MLWRRLFDHWKAFLMLGLIWPKKVAFVEFDPDKLSLEDMKKAVLGAGYKVAEGKVV